MITQLDKADIGKRCKEARKRAGLTLKAVANELGYKSGAAVANKENGLAYPSVEDIFFLSQRSGYSIEYIITGEGAIDGRGAPVDEFEERLLADLRILDDERRERLLIYLTKLKYGLANTAESRRLGLVMDPG